MVSTSWLQRNSSAWISIFESGGSRGNSTIFRPIVVSSPGVCVCAGAFVCVFQWPIVVSSPAPAVKAKTSSSPSPVASGRAWTASVSRLRSPFLLTNSHPHRVTLSSSHPCTPSTAPPPTNHSLTICSTLLLTRIPQSSQHPQLVHGVEHVVLRGWVHEI